MLWRYIPAKIQTFVCNIVALNYRSLLHSMIQLLQFNIAHSQFNVHVSNATLLEHATFLLTLWVPITHIHVVCDVTSSS